MKEISFSLRVSSEQYLAYYQGIAKNIIVRAHNGQTVQFPANLLQPFLTHGGIEGGFILQVDDQNKFLGIKKIE